MVEGAWRVGTMISNLQRVQCNSQAFNRDVFGHITKRKRTLEARIRGIQRSLDSVDSASLTLLHNQLLHELNQVLAQEEVFWFQKA